MKKKLIALALTAALSLGFGISATADSIPSTGKAVIDFGDQAFFTVNMHSEEKVYLKLDTTYQNTVSAENEIDFDRFYNFVGDADSFSHKGLLFLPAEPDCAVYQIDPDGTATELESEYVTEYVTILGGQKANGYIFFTRNLGNYGIATE